MRSLFRYLAIFYFHPSVGSLAGFPFHLHAASSVLAKSRYSTRYLPEHASRQLARPGVSARGTGDFFCLGLSCLHP